MKGAEAPSRSPRTLFTFNSEQDVRQFATGCDADIGGTSTVHLELNRSAKDIDEIGKEGTGVFWGDMRLGVKAGLEGKVRGGYAGFRNKVRFVFYLSVLVFSEFGNNEQKRPMLFGELTEDVSNHRYVALRLRLGGDAATHNSYFCNIQTDSPVTTDLWQHRLYFKRRDGGWENIYVRHSLIN
jgi:NADH dehydrogenase [ubiquinone] 1 alpha subcomplex assembly factor 1